MRDRSRAIDGTILDAYQQCGVALAQKAAGRGQPRHAKALLEQRIDGWISHRIFCHEHE
jgi:hypothetical protein